MQKKFRKLVLAIKEQKIDESILTYIDLIKNDMDQKVLVSALLKDLIPILYRTKYFYVPHGLMGLMAGIDLAKHLDENKYLPIVQAIIYVAYENKLAPLVFSNYTPLYIETDDSIKTMESFILEGDVAKTYRYFLGLNANNSLEADFHAEIFKMAMKDTVNIGHKAIYYHKILELLAYLGKEQSNIYYPSISYLTSEPKDFTTNEHACREYEYLKDLKINVQENKQQFSVEESLHFVDLIINSMRSRVLNHITKYLQNGVSIQCIADTLMLAASQLILDTETDQWIRPLHSFNYCFALNWWIRKYTNKDRVLALYMMASFINQISIEHKKVHFMVPSVYIQNKNLLINIKNSITSSNVSNSVALTQSYLRSGYEESQLIKQLILLSCQNSSLKSFTHDMKLASSCVSEYNQNSSPSKWLILVALAKQLSQTPKDYSYYKMFCDALNMK